MIANKRYIDNISAFEDDAAVSSSRVNDVLTRLLLLEVARKFQWSPALRWNTAFNVMQDRRQRPG